MAGSYQARQHAAPAVHHVNDIAPTLYELLGITPPRSVWGFDQDALDGISLAYTFDDASARGRKGAQYFEIFGSRGIYQDGWFASAFGLREPWVAASVDIKSWDPMQDQWQLFDLDNDFALAHDLATEHPDKLAELKELFMSEARANKVLPIGGAFLTVTDPTQLKRPTTTHWIMHEGMTRIPESEAPKLNNGDLRIEIDAVADKGCQGVLFALGGYAGGVSMFVDDGRLYYEYSALLLRRTKVDVGALPRGEVTIAMEMHTQGGWAAPAQLTFWINGNEVKQATIERTAPLGFTASETFDVGMDLNSPVADAYFDRAPFRFTGKLRELRFAKL